MWKRIFNFLISKLFGWLFPDKPVSTEPTNLNLGVDIAPEISAGLNLTTEAIKAGLTITAYKNTPAYLAAVKAYREQLARDTDAEVSTKALAGDKEAQLELERRSS